MLKLSRREFLGLSVLTAASASVAYASALSLSQNIQVNEVEIPIPDLAPEFDNYRLGFLTDLHLGQAVPHEWIEQAVKPLKAARVDLMLLGGDYLWVPDSFPGAYLPYLRNKRFKDLSESELPSAIIREIADLVSDYRPPDGTCAVLGNHDRWKLTVDDFAVFEQRGITLLINELLRIRRGDQTLTIIGVDDYWTGVPRWPLQVIESSCVLLSHNPDFVSYLLNNTKHRFALALCGHTHGGQVKIPGIGAPYLNIRDITLSEGLAQQFGSWVYTSRGIGVSKFPFRINCPPEVVILTLKAGC